MAESIIESQFSKYKVDTTMERIFQFPLIRMIIAILFLVPPSLIIMGLDYLLSIYVPDSLDIYMSILKSVIFFLLLLIFYKLYVNNIEQRDTTEISAKGWEKEISIGIIIGAALLLSVVGVIALLGYFKIESFTGNYLILIQGIFTFGSAAFMEEIFFRLIVFKLTEELFGSWIALIIQAFLFGMVHLANPNADLTAAISIMLSAGLMLTAIYMYTRRVWLVLGLHFIWNYIQGSVFGIAVSGNEVKGIMSSSLSGPDFLSGGAFGVESSIFTIIFCMIVFVFYLVKVIKQGNCLQPRWVRNRSK